MPLQMIQIVTRRLRGTVASYHPRAVPLMSRQCYDRELLSWGLLPVMLSGIESGTLAIFVKKTFAGVEGITPELLNYAVAMIVSAKAIGHLTSFVWARLSHGRPKVRMIAVLQFATAAMVGLLALVPRTPGGLSAAVLLSVTAWTVWSGVITLRTGVWRANYQRGFRARVAGKLATVQALTIAATGAMVGAFLDVNPLSYRWLFPTLCLAGLAGALVYRRIKVRQQGRLLRAEQSECDALQPSFNPLRMAQVLTHDKPFRNYMVCMFLLGIGNLMIHAPLAIVLTDVFQASYLQGIAIMTVVPLIVMSLVIPLWGRLLDRVHVVQFRAIHAWSFVISTGLFWLGTATEQFPLLLLAASALGVGWGGGVLAWNLGHQHFAPPHRDGQYMGVHVTLTGIRGFVGPMISVTLYGLFASWGNGSQVFAVCFLCNLLGAIGFVWLARFSSASSRPLLGRPAESA